MYAFTGPKLLTIAAAIVLASTVAVVDNLDSTLPEPDRHSIERNFDLEVALSAREPLQGGLQAGSATVRLDIRVDHSTTGNLILNGVQADNVAIRQGFAGESGPIVASFVQDSPTRWSLPDSARFTHADMDGLVTGGLYVEAVSRLDADIVVRGQIVIDDIEVYAVDLSGPQEVPPRTSGGTARAAVTLNRVSGALVAHLTTVGVAETMGAHIHAGPAGMNGPIVIGLTQDPDDAAHWFVEDGVLSATEIDLLDRAGLYLNVHTADSLDGEVRGQITTEEGASVGFALLTGNEVAPAVVTNRLGVAATTVDGTRLTSHVNLIGSDDVTAVVIAQALATHNGPEVFTLVQDSNEPFRWSIEDQPLTGLQYGALAREEYYVVVRTRTFAHGEIRGQIIVGGMEGADTLIVVAQDEGAEVLAGR